MNAENIVYCWDSANKVCKAIEMSRNVYWAINNLMCDFWNEKYEPVVQDLIERLEFSTEDLAKLEPYKECIVDNVEFEMAD